jgi:hypothetical protein
VLRSSGTQPGGSSEAHGAHPTTVATLAMNKSGLHKLACLLLELIVLVFERRLLSLFLSPSVCFSWIE